MLSLLMHAAVDYTYNYTITPSGDSGAGAASGALIGFCVAWLAIAVVLLVAMVKVYTKAGKPGWAAIVPFYNTWVLAEIGGKPGWWLFLMFIPFVNIVVSVLIALGIARNFGKSDAFGIVGLWLFSIVGYMMLGFGSSTYKGSASVVSGASTVPSASAPMSM